MASLETFSGIAYCAFFILSNKLVIDSSSNGNLPHNNAYNITPHDQKMFLKKPLI